MGNTVQTIANPARAIAKKAAKHHPALLPIVDPIPDPLANPKELETRIRNPQRALRKDLETLGEIYREARKLDQKLSDPLKKRVDKFEKKTLLKWTGAEGKIDKEINKKKLEAIKRAQEEILNAKIKDKAEYKKIIDEVLTKAEEELTRIDRDLNELTKSELREKTEELAELVPLATDDCESGDDFHIKEILALGQGNDAFELFMSEHPLKIALEHLEHGNLNAITTLFNFFKDNSEYLSDENKSDYKEVSLNETLRDSIANFRQAPVAGAPPNTNSSQCGSKDAELGGGFSSSGASSENYPVDEDWYTEEQVNGLLQYYFQTTSEIELLTAMLGTDWVAGNTLNGSLEEFKAQRESCLAAGQTVKDKIIIPLNLGTYEGRGMHWVLLFIKFPKDASQSLQISYFDPVGESIHKDVENALKKARLNGDNEQLIISSTAKLQHDGYNCGPWIVAVAEYLVTQERGADAADKAFDIDDALSQLIKLPIKDIRNEQLKLLARELNVPEAGRSAPSPKASESSASFFSPNNTASTSSQKAEGTPPVVRPTI